MIAENIFFPPYKFLFNNYYLSNNENPLLKQAKNKSTSTMHLGVFHTGYCKVSNSLILYILNCSFR